MIEIKCPNCGIIQVYHYQYPVLFWGEDIKGTIQIGGGTSCDCKEFQEPKTHQGGQP